MHLIALVKKKSMTYTKTKFNDSKLVYVQESSDSSGITAVNCQSDHRSSHFFSLSQAAMGFFSSIAVNFFRSHDSSFLPQHISCAHIIDESKIGSFCEENIVKSCDMYPDIHSVEFSDFDAYGSMNLKDKVEKNSENIELLPVAKTKGLKQFKQFDIVDDCSDHHFAAAADGKGSALSQARIFS